MILTRKKSLILPRRFNTPKQQRGSIILSQQGSSASAVLCTAGSSSIPDRSCFETGIDAEVGARWHSDGDVYEKECSSSWSFDGTWIGDCANTEYEGSWIVTGDDPTDGVPNEGVWATMDNEMFVEYIAEPGPQDSFSGTFTFRLRRVLDQVTILTDTFVLDAEAEE